MTSAISLGAPAPPPDFRKPPRREPPAQDAPRPESRLGEPARTGAVKMERLLAKLDAKLLHARLVIEKDEDLGDYVYKLVDDKTGQVQQRWPRQTLMEMIREMTPRSQTALLVDAWA
jgi:hypothetical protein